MGYAPADEGVLGTLPSTTHFFIRFFVPWGCYTACFVIFLLLIFGMASLRAVNPLAAMAVLFCTAGSAVRRLMPLLWSEAGCLTFTRVHIVEAALVPRTVPGRSCLAALLCDFITLPFIMALSAFRHVRPFTIFGTFLYTPNYYAPALFFILFWILPIIGMSVFCWFHLFLYPSYCSNPQRSQGTRGMGVLVGVGGAAAVLIMCATTTTMSALPCEEEDMRYAAGIKCFSGVHRAHIFFGSLGLLLCGAALEISLGSFRRLRYEEPPERGDVEARTDGLFLELFLILRWLIVIIATTSVHPVILIFVSIAAALIFAYFLKAPMSSVRSLNDLYQALLAELVLFGVLLPVLSLANGWGVLVWLLLWAAGTGAGAFLYIKRNGKALFDNETDYDMGTIIG